MRGAPRPCLAALSLPRPRVLPSQPPLPGGLCADWRGPGGGSGWEAGPGGGEAVLQSCCVTALPPPPPGGPVYLGAEAWSLEGGGPAHRPSRGAPAPQGLPARLGGREDRRLTAILDAVTRFFAARPPSGEPSPGGVLRPHPAGEAGDAHAAPPVLRVWPVEELRMARPAPAWRSPVAPGPEAWEDCWRGSWGEGAAPRRRPSPGVADPRRSQLAQRHGGRRFPEGLCGTLLPGDRRSGNQVYDVIAPADQ